MIDLKEELLLELDRAIAEGKSSLVSREISIAELEKELLAHRIEASIGQTVLDALLRRREALTEHIPQETPAVERKPPQMPEGRVVVNHATSVKRDASECILMLFEVEPGPHTVERIAAEVYGDSSPRNLKRAQMRIHALKREGLVDFTPPLLASTLVRKVP